ncbi:uncharacterized protein [Argopecten irradians]|uniref:uncharacterized protein n=1 Tax=Argopecten irradians TaxID=31199 RepID=UPI003720F1D7
MSKRICCISGCSNGGYRLNIWKSRQCVLHNSNYGTNPCTCKPPFKLFPFPNDTSIRMLWTKNVNRKSSKSKNWQPNADSRICSSHFIDGAPSAENPIPTLLLGYEVSSKITPRKLPKRRMTTLNSDPPETKKIKQDTAVTNSVCQHDTTTEKVDSTVVHYDHAYIDTDQGCQSCVNKDVQIQYLKKQIQTLSKELAQWKGMYTDKVNRPFCYNDIKSDKDMKFYTGIQSIKAFDAIFNVVRPNITRMKYWHSSMAGKIVCNPLKYKRIPTITSTRRCLSSKDEMLLTLMKLRLGILNQELALKFGVSRQTVSNIFTTWTKLLTKFLGALVFNPPKEVVRENLPLSFQNTRYRSVRHIIDCTEIFLETPQNLSLKTNTWSDYKHHNTAKYLISITPSGMINFVSKGWGGRTSDKHITNHCGFLDIVEPTDTVLADRGFTIAQDLALLQAQLLIPPGRRGTTQFTKDEVRKTKQIANRRIYVEQAIRRMKCFRILKYELPLTMLHHLDDIVRIVAGICNLYPPLSKYTT